MRISTVCGMWQICINRARVINPLPSHTHSNPSPFKDQRDTWTHEVTVTVRLRAQGLLTRTRHHRLNFTTRRCGRGLKRHFRFLDCITLLRRKFISYLYAKKEALKFPIQFESVLLAVRIVQPLNKLLRFYLYL